jgi:hypothetical protein
VLVASTETPRPGAVRERGYAATSGAGSLFYDLTEELTPELVWPLSVQVFDRMRKTDAQVSSVLRAVTSPIIRTQWRVDGSGCAEEVTRFVADNLGLPILDDSAPDAGKAKLRGRSRFSWDEHLRLALLMLPFGHSFFEQVYYPPDDEGLYRLRKLGPRLAPTISNVKVARDGGLISIEQYGFDGGASTTTLPVNRLVAYVLEREGGNWLGISIMRSAYKHWLLKDRALRTWSLSIDRNGVGVPIYTAADKEASLDAGLALAASVRSGDNAGGAVPHGAEFELKGVTGTLPNIDQFVRYQDEQIARSALGHVLNLGSQGGGQVGSYNLGSVLKDAFHLGLDAVAGVVATTASAHIVEDMVDLNFGPTEPAPQIVYDDIGTRMTELDRIREQAGLSSDADLVKFLRTIPDQEANSA